MLYETIQSDWEMLVSRAVRSIVIAEKISPFHSKLTKEGE